MSRFECEQADYERSIYDRHTRLSGYLKKAHERARRSFGLAKANRLLADLDERLRFDGYKSADMSEESVRNLAKIRSERCEEIWQKKAGVLDLDDAARLVWSYCEYSGVAFPFDFTKKRAPEKYRADLLGAVSRVCSERWWRRQLRVVTSRQVESVLREIGEVRAERSPYVSERSFKQWLFNQKRNRQTVEAFEAVTGQGLDEESVSLADCVDASVSNPLLRRGELMTRIRGFEEVAISMGFAGLFLTLTAPSKYHAMANKRGRNQKFRGDCPRDVMAYLNGVWARIRADLGKQKVRFFGFRVAEPHHDGTPHFHFMLFISADQAGAFKEAFGRHALAEDGDEAGALENRWDCVDIDPEKGTASGYVAKYVAKNIDGFAVGVDDEGDVQGEEGALRARAWASIWGIRQFQQIGGVSVTVWRELRRRCEALEVPDEAILEIHGAADRGEWARFVELMGGPVCRRDEQAIRPLYEEADAQTEYGEQVSKLIGLWLQGVARALGRCAVITRGKVWRIRRREAAIDEGAKPPNLDLCQ